MNDINLLAITTNEQNLLSPIDRGIVQNNNYYLNGENMNNKEVGIEEKLTLNSNKGNESNSSDPFIPSKYKHKFNYLKISIKNIKNNNDLYNKYTKSKKKKNELP